MECNKDEAVRAMQLSVKRIQNKDFKGAKDMALKAQRLYPQLDNISRLITVCEVHCSAEKKVGGSEMDWYSILQAQKSDDNESIRRHYRKLVLQLHPDKNSLPGAEAAFKLIGEAYGVLSDQGSRSKYDIKYSALLGAGSRSFGHQSSINSFGPRHSSAATSNSQSRYTSVNLQQPPNVQQPVQPDTIKIACPSCKRMYDYNFANRLIFCQRCLGIFDASDLGLESLGNRFPNHTVASSQASQSNGRTGTRSSTTFQNGIATSKMASAAEVGGASKTIKRDIGNGVGIEKQGVGRSEPNPLKSKDSRKKGNMLRKRGENSTHGSDDSCKTGKGAQADTDVIVQNKVSNSSEVGQNISRRSARSMHNPSFSETLDDDDDKAGDVCMDGDGNAGPSEVRQSSLSTATKKRVNGSVDGAYRPTVLALFAMGEYDKLGKQRWKRIKSYTGEFELQVEETSMADGNGSKFIADNNGRKSVADSNGRKSVVDNNASKSVADNDRSKSMQSMRKINEVPEPEFHTFVLKKAELQRTFKANQTWVLYDPVDGMPRLYACIRKVLSPGFKVKITWLEPNPDDQGEVDWCSKKLPVACGKFRLGLTEEVTDHTLFSHEYIHSRKGKGIISSYRIYPRKGETWALYQDWDLGWSSEPEKHSQYKFDFVELLSDFSETNGARVCYLDKIKAFVSLFEPAEQHRVLGFQVSPNELYRFSHQIPSHKMTGREGYGVPANSFEFDPASLPASLFDRRSTVTIARPSGFIPSSRACPAAKEVKNDPESREDKNEILNVEPIVID